MGLENQDFEMERGPSWERANWPLSATDDFTAALDPTQMAVEVKAAAKAAGKPLAEADAVAAASDSIRAMMLVRPIGSGAIWPPILIPWAFPNRISRRI